MADAATQLRAEFTSRPGGMFILGYENIPDWSIYSGYKNQLAFSLVQNVSHTHIMMYSDLSMLLLRFAQITAPEFSSNNNVVDYYLGNFFWNNQGNYWAHFDKIKSDSPFYLFGILRNAEKSGNFDELHDALYEHPLFVPAVDKLVRTFYGQPHEPTKETSCNISEVTAGHADNQVIGLTQTFHL